MTRRQDLGALLFHLAGYSKIREGLFRIRRHPATRIITFHDVQDEAVGPFREKLAILKQTTNVVSIDDYLVGRLTHKRINIVVTFDDGYKGWIGNAVPALKEAGLPATFFITSGFVGLSLKSERDFVNRNIFRASVPRKVTGGLSPQDVRLLVEEGFTLGGHTRTHCDLRNILNAGEARSEIAEDRLALEEIAGAKVDVFAYPMGGFENARLDLGRCLKELGFRAAVTTVPGFNFRDSDPFLLHRDLTDVSMPTHVFKARIAGNYDAISSVKRTLARILKGR